MIVYQCRVCGFVFDETIEGRVFSTLECCPSCGEPLTSFDIKLKADDSETGEAGSFSNPASDSDNGNAYGDVLDTIVSGLLGASIGAAAVSTASSISTAHDFSKRMRSKWQ